MNEIIFKISDTHNIESILPALSNLFMVQREKTVNITEHYFDTFDWRLYNRDLSFIHSGRDYRIFEYSANREVFSGKSNSVRNRYSLNSFNKAAQDHLKDIIQNRALLKICKCKRNSDSYKIFNHDKKIVLRVFVDNLVISNDLKSEFTSKIIRLVPLRGYTKELKKMSKIFLDNNFTLLGDNYLGFIYGFFGRVPGQFSSKISLQLDKSLQPSEAVRLILSKLLDVIIECESGIKKDHDIEFLHDYRVSIRKSRVILGEFKNVISPELRVDLKRILSLFGKKTNTVRDLDVYLAKKAGYESYLPDLLKKELNPLFEKIRRERSSEFRKLKRYLNSEDYKNNILQLEVILEGNFKGANTSQANIPVLELSKTIIARRCKLIIKSGRKITSKSREQELHNLRLECKKLRYLLELFYSLFPRGKVNYIIKQLKVLQDNLGEFNDLSVQQLKMKDYLDNFKNGSDKNMKLATVIGGLITSMHRKQLEVREDFFSTFKGFDSPENRKVIKKLFY